MGLNLAGIEKQGTPDHKYQYIGGEKQEEFGLQWYDLQARQYDPQLGRFFAADPLADLYSDWSPYQYSYNSPLSFLDPSGMGPQDWYNGKGGVQYDPNVHSQADLDRMGIQGKYLGREGYGINEQTGQTVHYLPGGGTQEYTPMLGGASVVGQSDNSGLVDGIQMALDGVGMTEVPVLSQVAELTSAGISLGRGDYIGAAMGLGSMIPIAGKAFEAAKIGRRAKKALSIIEEGSEGADEFITLYRGDSNPSLIMKSYAAREGGYAYSQSLIQNGDSRQLMIAHADNSRIPPSPFISVTSDPKVARYFAGPNGTVHTLKIHNSRAIYNKYNYSFIPGGIKENEYLVPNYIRLSEIVR